MASVESNRMLADQAAAMHARFPGLDLRSRSDGQLVVSGALGFSVTHEGQTVETEYAVEIVIPKGYPEAVPGVLETGGRTPGDFHKLADGSLCLGAPLEVQVSFAQNPTLLGFVERQVIPYLFSHAWWERSGKMPFGERAHGTAGILQSYQEQLGTNDVVTVLNLLRILADDSYHGHTLCPCGSGSKLRHCHGQTLLRLKEHRSRQRFLLDHACLLQHAFSSDPTLNAVELTANSIRRKGRRRR